MVLMQALRKTSRPHPAPTELVSISTFIEEHITGLQRIPTNLIIGSQDRLDHVQVEATPLHVGDAKIGDGPADRVTLLSALGNAASDLADLIDRRPAPSFG